MKSIVLLVLSVTSGLDSDTSGGIDPANLKDKTMEKPNLNKFLLPPEANYMDWWKITEDNIKQRYHITHNSNGVVLHINTE